MKPFVSPVVIARSTALVGSVGLAQSHPGERRVREHAVGHQATAGAALAAGEIVPDDPKIVVGDVRELRAAGAFPHGPDVGRARLQPPVDADVAARIQFDAGVGEADPGGVRRAARRHQDVAARDVSLAGGGVHDDVDVLAGPAVHTQRLGRRDNLDAVIAKNPLHLIGDVGVLAAAHEPRSMLDDRDAAGR